MNQVSNKNRTSQNFNFRAYQIKWNQKVIQSHILCECLHSFSSHSEKKKMQPAGQVWVKIAIFQNARKFCYLRGARVQNLHL